ncbi:MAG: hypothetical protein LBH36_02845 [Candidatus Nomurabacteria bacterium]|jgi:transcriptional regulator NrdR family protein|nr:hypothetical protein [Candidatus Nomurabacteria bacterium]
MGRTIVHHNHKKRDLFKPERLLNSLVTCALANRWPEGKASDTMTHVVRDVEKWLEKRALVTSKDIRRVAAKSLERFDKDLAESYAMGDKII